MEHGEARYMAHAIDTLDLNFYIDWGGSYYQLEAELKESKLNAQADRGKYFVNSERLGQHVMGAKGRRNGYSYHLQYPDFNMWIAPQKEPLEKPNVIVSPAAEWLWRDGPSEVASQLTSLLSEAGGDIQRVQIGRADLASDWCLENAPTHQYFVERIVARSEEMDFRQKGQRLETVYIGASASSIQVRIYDKLRQMMSSPGSQWLLSYLEQGVEGTNLWRIEFQLRRRALAEFGIESVDDLNEKIGGLWEYLTTKNLSLREPDNKNTQRRTLSRWWQQVVNIRGMWGKRCELKRVSDAPKERDPAWYVRQLAGFVVSYAACLAIKDKAKAAEALLTEAMERLDMRDWTSAYAKKRISMGLPVEEPEVFGDLF